MEETPMSCPPGTVAAYDNLATVANNRVVAPLADAKPFDLITRPTALQRKAFKRLGVRLQRTQ